MIPSKGSKRKKESAKQQLNSEKTKWWKESAAFMKTANSYGVFFFMKPADLSC